jgi:ubiquinone/menaquinone biosynthesis C-methylase UbiE
VPVDEREVDRIPHDEHEASSVPERAAPEEMSGHLMESEHRGRYLWAAELASGLDVIDAGCGTGYGSEILAAAGARKVTGIDISEDAVAAAKASSSHARSEFRLASLHELPFEDASFDLAVCFEVIEHVEDQPRAIGQLRRVLKQDGVLAISSPNRDVYPPGNPHHIHEFVPAELEQTLRVEFKNVRLYRQSPWLTAAIFDDAQSEATGVEHQLEPKVMKVASVAPGEEMYTVALASDGELPEAHAIALMGTPFELRWWQEQLTAARENGQLLLERQQVQHEELHSAAREAATLRQAAATAHENERVSAQRVLEVEASLANSQARVAALAEAYEAHERQLAELRERVDRADRVQAAMKRSLSWRVTAPLRLLKRRR